MSWLSQIFAITRLGLQTIPQRKGSSLAAAFGIAGVVAVLVGVLSIAKGFEQTMRSSGSPDTAIVMRSGSSSEMMSVLAGPDTRIIADTAGIARTDQGPLASAELFVVIDLPKRSTGTSANVPMRGVEPAAFEIRKDFQLIAGRRFEWGRNEIMVGQGAATEFAGLDLGRTILIGKNQWSVVGIFSAGGGVAESELWTDAAVLQPAYQRGNSFQTVHARLSSADAFLQLKDDLTSDPRLDVKVMRQDEYYAEESEQLVGIITSLGLIIATLMAIGATFGALNTMYTAVSARTREIATLRAIGFKAAPVVTSVLIESLCLAMAGGLIGSGAAYLAFDGLQTATMNWSSFSQVAFAFAVTPALLLMGTIYASVIGLIGGLFPAIRAACMPVADALRES
jgi:putative ABC transport system permease protein